MYIVRGSRAHVRLQVPHTTHTYGAAVWRRDPIGEHRRSSTTQRFQCRSLLIFSCVGGGVSKLESQPKL